jgi:transcriptional regulator with XRE-family HTH domain
MMKLNEAIGDVLRQIRREKCMTLSQVSEKSFVSIPHISDTERGVTNISPDLLEAVAFALDTPSYRIVQIAGARMKFYNKNAYTSPVASVIKL